MSIWYSVTNAIDCAITDAVHKGDGRRWAEKVVPGKTYYTIAETRQPWADNPKLLEEHVFEKVGFVSGRLERAEGVYNAHGGRIYDNRNSGPCKGLMTIGEYTEWVNDTDGPNIHGSLSDYASPDPRRAGSSRRINTRY